MLAYETFIKRLSLDNPWAGTSRCKTTRCTYYSQQQGSRMTHSKSTQDHEHTWWLHDRRCWKTEEAWGWWLWGWWGLGKDGVVGYQQLPCPEETTGRKAGKWWNSLQTSAKLPDAAATESGPHMSPSIWSFSLLTRTYLMAILLQGQAHSLGPLLPPHHRMYSRGQLGFLFLGESFEVWLTQSLFFFFFRCDHFKILY